MRLPFQSELNPVSGLSTNAWKLLQQSEARIGGGNSAERGQKLIRPGESHNQCAHHSF